MDKDQLQHIATRYLGHLLQNPEARAQYASCDKADHAALGNLIQKHLSLHEALSSADVEAILQHGEELVTPLMNSMKTHAPEYYEALAVGGFLGTFTKP